MAKFIFLSELLNFSPNVSFYPLWAVNVVGPDVKQILEYP